MPRLLDHVAASGFPYCERLIHLFVGGSELHGAKVQGTDDLDIYGAYIEPPEIALGLRTLPHYVWSTAGDDRRNGPNDVDVTLYSLRKWVGLACKGNPTALHFLFAKGEVSSSIWNKIVTTRHLLLSRACIKQFLGFADDQLKRMIGAKGRGKKGTRPEIEVKYGYDVKAAMHTLRLLGECKGTHHDRKSHVPTARPGVPDSCSHGTAPNGRGATNCEKDVPGMRRGGSERFDTADIA